MHDGPARQRAKATVSRQTQPPYLLGVVASLRIAPANAQRVRGQDLLYEDPRGPRNALRLVRSRRSRTFVPAELLLERRFDLLRRERARWTQQSQQRPLDDVVIARQRMGDRNGDQSVPMIDGTMAFMRWRLLLHRS